MINEEHNTDPTATSVRPLADSTAKEDHDEVMSLSCLSPCLVEQTMVDLGVLEPIVVVNPCCNAKTQAKMAEQRRIQQLRRRLGCRLCKDCVVTSVAALVVLLVMTWQQSVKTYNKSWVRESVDQAVCFLSTNQ